MKKILIITSILAITSLTACNRDDRDVTGSNAGTSPSGTTTNDTVSGSSADTTGPTYDAARDADSSNDEAAGTTSGAGADTSDTDSKDENKKKDSRSTSGTDSQSGAANESGR